jgi:cytochrome c biogenesis protein CcmG, thiol:disulfide interchange protein DsbE
VKGKTLLFMLGGLTFGVLFGILLLFLQSHSNPVNSQRLPPTVGSAMKDFSLKNLSGEQVNISGFKGKPIVLNFWATWCPPCKEEMPLLEQTAKANTGNLLVIGVDYAEEKSVVEQFILDRKITFPILLDQGGIVSEMYFVKNYPMTFFIDRDGVLRAQHLGQLSNELLTRYLEQIGISQ